MERRERRHTGRRLTDRQAAILELVGEGLENKEIAHELGVSEQAVKEHVSTLLRRLDVRNRAELGGAAATLRMFGTTGFDEAWQRFLFQAAPVAVAVVVGSEHRIALYNEAFAAAVGDRDLADARYADVFPGSALLDQLEQVIANGIAIHDHRGLALQPLPREDGTTGGVAIFAMDAQRLRA